MTTTTTRSIEQLAPAPLVPVSWTDPEISIQRPHPQRNFGVQLAEIETGSRAAGTLAGGLAIREQQSPISCDLATCASLNRPIETSFIIPDKVGAIEHALVRKAQEALRSALVHSTSDWQRLWTFLQDSRGMPLESVSLEFLTWMLQDIGSAKFGLYVSDYFKHVAKSTLKYMCLRLLSNCDLSTDERDIFTVCTNAAAHKFLTTVLMVGEHDNELTEHLRLKSSEYKKAAQAALDRIRLMTIPSLSLLQAILCGVFLHQGSGNTHYCYELTRAACSVATDLGLHLDSPDGSQKRRTEEEIYCVLWCYMLDKNYAWRFEPGRSYFDTQPGVIDHYAQCATAELLAIYIVMAQVQDETSLLLKSVRCTLSDSTRPILRTSIALLLQRVEEVRQRIQKIASASANCWKGLDAADEIAALQYAQNSIHTTILYLSEQLQGQVPGSGELLLKSARQELSSLLAICLIDEKHRAVGFLHWTLMYYPLTASFVLFCNAVMTSHFGDLNLLQTVATVLMPSVPISQPVAVIQQLVEEFVTLSQPLVSNANIGSVVGQGGDTSTLRRLPPSLLHHQHLPAGETIPPVWTDAASTFFTSDLSAVWTPNEEEIHAALLDFSLPIPLEFDFSNDFPDLVPNSSSQ
ncbi:hypothetical protein BO78DRAFT_400511 [Aspergillus sclerotiicarbonarius CBS 121057]|uniref:Xylanolytic transcriptional activator regulatory domain-containing protein n=1 Tax=Aspergillus sclerotiicarbonarius (strain CBS 121057 / IBT 28362) TaxID=1448318 RepID=A0A319ENZ1_ASPSB|nr:hypothetical protein BO78DRAFT_400511 [Aspergillus sclerotiicarbonarius CBS 121057]